MCIATSPTAAGAVRRDTGPVALRATQEGKSMLHYAVVFFVIALVAALFGFTGIAVGAAGIAKILFLVFLVIAAATFIMSLTRRGT
jgi:uncharacterized membrane protein YtjA (UPF0391 family)